ncbi:YibE/F family protein [Demequina sp. TTPB684]|uniref:YibE/F family protein n=1 Tax=unclassified Demequina TaxID=2620311 RepID=UPI001CF2D1CB|nr:MULTISPECIES: YibE/F family protein [unclassified Demequina]MCB2413296.1 YibE/F family protein [Demequina sp. TTPB684]UPU88984.1 YibE/F family protein [Demequina sp. TMPB413]
MGAGHSHDGPRPRASERTTTILSVIVGVIIFVTLWGAAAVWPDDFSFRGSLDALGEGSTWVSATIESVAEDGSATAMVKGEEGAYVKPISTFDDPTIVLQPGDKVRALELPTGELGFSDFERSSPMLALFIAYVIVVLAVARWRGLGALLGLVVAFGVVFFFTIPALFDGGNALVIGLVTGSGALFALLYMAHGPNARTTTAYLGTLAGLAVTTVLAWWAVDASKLMGFWSENRTHLEFFERGVSLQGILLSGIVLAGLGVLNDVTVTQASAVWELRAVRPDLGWVALYLRGMRIGRDHIASTVYTIAFAYVGAALPTLMFISLYGTSLGFTLTSSDIAEEVVRTLVGSIGLVLAVPLTTAIGALVVASPGSVARTPETEQHAE